MKEKNEIEKELDRKEFENSLNRTLSSQERQRETAERMNSNYHPVGLALMNFFGTYIICYFMLMIVKWFIGPFLSFVPGGGGLFSKLSHLLILGLSIAAVIMKKSPLDRWIR